MKDSTQKLLVGLTGGLASGKTSAQQAFETLGVATVDQDQVAREVVMPGSAGLNALVDLVSQSMCNNSTQPANSANSQILLDDQSLNRTRLRQLLFNDSHLKHQVEALLHPLIRARSAEHILAFDQNPQYQYIILVSPLLVEAQLTHLVDKVVVIDIPTELQLQRVMQRDAIDHTLAMQIINQQASRKQRLAYANYIIENNTTLLELKAKVADVHQQLLAIEVSGLD